MGKFCTVFTQRLERMADKEFSPSESRFEDAQDALLPLQKPHFGQKVRHSTTTSPTPVQKKSDSHTQKIPSPVTVSKPKPQPIPTPSTYAPPVRNPKQGTEQDTANQTIFRRYSPSSSWFLRGAVHLAFQQREKNSKDSCSSDSNHLDPLLEHLNRSLNQLIRMYEDTLAICTRSVKTKKQIRQQQSVAEQNCSLVKISKQMVTQRTENLVVLDESVSNVDHLKPKQAPSIRERLSARGNAASRPIAIKVAKGKKYGEITISHDFLHLRHIVHAHPYSNSLKSLSLYEKSVAQR